VVSWLIGQDNLFVSVVRGEEDVACYGRVGMLRAISVRRGQRMGFAGKLGFILISSFPFC
jgi:hypothetical protein